MIKGEYDGEFDFPIEICADPYAERTVYDVEKTTFKNRRKSEENEENILFYHENENI